MALFLLSKRPHLVLIFFLIANPVQGHAGGKVGDYRWKNRGCIAVFNSIYSNTEIDLKEVLPAFSTANPSEQKQLDSAFGGVVKFARANPDKIAAASGLVLSSCLLYHSIRLTQDIRLLYGKFKELRREFDEFVESKLPKIEKFVLEIRRKTETGSVLDDKEHQHMMFVLMRFYEEVEHVLGKVRGLIEEAIRTQKKSNFLAGASFIVATAAAFAIGAPVFEMSDLAYRLAGATGFLSTTAGVLSLMNARDCQLALNEMREYKKELEGLNRKVLRMHKHFERQALHDWWSEFAFWINLPDYVF